MFARLGALYRLSPLYTITPDNRSGDESIWRSPFELATVYFCPFNVQRPYRNWRSHSDHRGGRGPDARTRGTNSRSAVRRNAHRARGFHFTPLLSRRPALHRQRLHLRHRSRRNDSMSSPLQCRLARLSVGAATVI